ncbi:MAG: hypothetical protein WA424_18850, partial [Candidatus Sulfotelmatobacter sp.]
MSKRGIFKIVIPNKRSLRGEESGRAARRVAFFATHQSRVWLASLSNSATTSTSFYNDRSTLSIGALPAAPAYATSACTPAGTAALR